MLVSLQMASFYHRTTFLLEHFHLVLMHEKVLMKYCTQYQIMVTWTRCYFMYSWINCSFQKPDIQQVKNFLILVGHGSHLDIKTIHLCRASNIHLYCLPPHTTHIFQPLDVVIFHPVKSHFSRWIAKKQILRSCSRNHENQCQLPWQNRIHKMWYIPSG